MFREVTSDAGGSSPSRNYHLYEKQKLHIHAPLDSKLQAGAGEFMEFTKDSDVMLLDERLSAYFKKAVLMMNLLLPLSLLAKRAYYGHTTTWVVVVFFTIALASFLLNFAGAQSAGRIQVGSSELKPGERRAVETLCAMAYVSVALLMLGALAFLLFLDLKHAYIAIIPLFPVATLVVFMFCRRRESPHAPEEERSNKFWGLGLIKGAASYLTDHEACLKLFFDFSMEVVSAAFAGLSGTVFGYIKSAPHQAVGVGAAECSLSYSIILGLLVVLLTLVPPETKWPESRNAVVKLYIPVLAYTMLLFLVLGGVVAAMEFLQGFVIATFSPVIVIALACFLKEYKDGSGNMPVPVPREAAGRHWLSFFIYSALFVALMASYSTYVGNGNTVVLSFKIFLGATLGAVVTYLSRALLVLHDVGRERLALAKRLLLWEMYVLLAIAFICGCFVAKQHPDVVKNII